jgi:hypothetical protein
MAVGRWGEEFVFKHLQQQIQAGVYCGCAGAAGGVIGGDGSGGGGGCKCTRKRFEVGWLNSGEESGECFDLTVTATPLSGGSSTGNISESTGGGNDGATLTTFIEVKTTASANKQLFEVSHREWLFAQKEGPSFQVYRVFAPHLRVQQQPQKQTQQSLPQQHVRADRKLDASIVRISNPYLQWRCKRLGVYLAF